MKDVKKEELGTLAASGEKVFFRIIRSARKTMAIQVTGKAEVLVRIPYSVSFRNGKIFADKNRDWIFARLSAARDRMAAGEIFVWETGSEVEYHGEPRILDVEAGGSHEKVTDDGRRLKVICPEAGAESVKRVVMNWYQEEARRFLKGRTEYWASQMNVDYKKITVRNQVSRWGSCSAKGNLNYNWRLILLPVELADYVIVHELAHRLEMNHSSRFWGQVEKILPDYKLRREKLKKYEIQINPKY